MAGYRSFTNHYLFQIHISSKLGDLNRPLQTPRPSFGTKLLLDWEDTGTVFILNKKEIHTRIDPFTGKGSTLDLGVVSDNIHKLASK